LHIPGRATDRGFNVITSNPSGEGQHTDSVISKSAQALFRNYSGDKPFFLSLGFLQPHDCCYWVFQHEGYKGGLPFEAIKDKLPPLPKNYEYAVKEPKALMKHFEHIHAATGDWTDEVWRYYIWSYYRHVEMVDAEIGRVLDALDGSKFASDTLIVFTADHGDGLARRKLISKWFPYDEAIRVPFIVCLPGRLPEAGGEVHCTGRVVRLCIPQNDRPLMAVTIDRFAMLPPGAIALSRRGPPGTADPRCDQ